MRNIFSTCGWLNKCLKLTRNHFSWKGSFFLLNFPMVDSSPPTGEDLLRDCLSPPDEGLGRGSPLRGVCLPPPDRGLWRKGLSRMLMTPFPSKIKLQSHNKYKKQFTCCVVLKLLLVVLFPFLNFDDVVSVTSVHVVRSLGEGVVVSVWLREDVVVSGLPVELLGRVVDVSWDDVHIHVVRVIQVVTFSVLVSMFLVVETDGLRLVVVVVVNVVVLVLVFGVDFSFSCLFELLKRENVFTEIRTIYIFCFIIPCWEENIAKCDLGDAVFYVETIEHWRVFLTVWTSHIDAKIYSHTNTNDNQAKNQPECHGGYNNRPVVVVRVVWQEQLIFVWSNFEK